ncbi:MAG: L-aspartate oxidase [Planctomycetota bacterium]
MDSIIDFEFARYLVPFDPRQVPQYRFDVLVVGSGAAGSTAALAASNAGSLVALISKARLSDSNTRWAQGGMAAVLDAQDSFEEHVQDTLRLGCGLAMRSVVERVVRAGPQAVEQLTAMGAEFDRTPQGDFDLTKEGGHSRHRIVHAQGDATGREIQHNLTRAVESAPDVTTFPGLFVLDLLSEPSGRVVGVLCRTERGERVAFLASQVILATGGGGQIYRETTNPDIATADGVAMAARAGATLRDLEFIQFHPTCLYIAGAARVLISEIVRGAGGVLRDRQGVRFMPDYHPQADLAPRDVVSRAVQERMVATGDTSVYLDLSQVDRDPHQAFPGISRICRFFGIDIGRDPIPVRPGCHYMIGGLAVDGEGHTSVPGLWAVGECASTGLHGANRMGSNSLLEAIVLGSATGAAAARETAGAPPPANCPGALGEGPGPPPVQVNIDDLTYSLKSLMWRQLGVERSGEGMADALEKLRFWRRAVSALPLEGPRSWELVNMLTVSHLVTLAALAREESRGVHFRTDFAEPRDAWCCHLRLSLQGGGQGEGQETRGLRLEREPMPETVSSS